MSDRGYDRAISHGILSDSNLIDLFDGLLHREPLKEDTAVSR